MMEVAAAAGFAVVLLTVVAVIAGRRHIARLYRHYARRP